jgi:formylglycine-generating enzyme required for sulfatase activity
VGEDSHSEIENCQIWGEKPLESIPTVDDLLLEHPLISSAIKFKPSCRQTFSYQVVKLDPQGNITSREMPPTEATLKSLSWGTSVFQCEMANIPAGSFLMGSPEPKQNEAAMKARNIR